MNETNGGIFVVVFVIATAPVVIKLGTIESELGGNCTSRQYQSSSGASTDTKGYDTGRR